MLLIADIRCFATDSSFDEAQLKDYINEAQKYDLSGMNFEIENNVNDNNAEKIFKKVYNMLFKELRQSFHIMLYLIIICILSSLIKVYVSGIGLAEVGNYACYCACASLVLVWFSDAVKLCMESINNLCDFMKLTFPVMASVITTAGYAGTAATSQGVFVVVSTIIAVVVQKIIFPLLFCCGLLSVVSGVSTTLNLSGLIKLISKSSKYIIGFLLTVFGGILTFSGISTASSDGVFIRGAKYAVSNFVPIVGACLSDALNSVVRSSLLMKNRIGYIGFFVLLSICISPVIKTAITLFFFRLCASSSQLFSENKIASLIDSVCNVLTSVMSMLIMVTLMFVLIIGVLASVGSYSG